MQGISQATLEPSVYMSTMLRIEASCIEKKNLENIYTRPKTEFHMHNRVGVLMLSFMIQDCARMPQM